PGLAHLTRHVHLHQASDRAPPLIANACDGDSKTTTVHRMDHLESVDYFRLVALKVSDEVPPDREAHFAHLRQRFLHLVLTDVRDTAFPRGQYRVRTVRLGHRNDRNPLCMSTSSDRRRDPLAHLGDACGEVW